MKRDVPGLSDKLDNLEICVANLEAQISGYSSIGERFMFRVLEEFSSMLNNTAFATKADLDRIFAVNGYVNSIISSDDIKQDICEYLLRWNLPASVSRSNLEEVWLPYLKRSINNAVVNLKKSWLSKKYDSPMHIMNVDWNDLEDCDAPVGPSFDDDRFEVEDLIDEICYNVDLELSHAAERILLELMFPSKRFLEAARVWRNSMTSRGTNKRFLSHYLDIPYRTVCDVFRQLLVVVPKICYD